MGSLTIISSLVAVAFSALLSPNKIIESSVGSVDKYFDPSRLDC